MSDKATARGLDALLDPASFAIIGATEDRSRIGGRPLAYARESGYAGRVYAVNPRGGAIQGLPAYRAVGEIEAPVDCAFVAVPGAAVIETLEACAASGVRAAVVISSGFAEAGRDGARRQARLRAIARESGMRILGPNCMGVMNLHKRFYCTFSASFFDTYEGWPPAGGLGILSQSGAFGSHVMCLARDRGADISKWITTGNEADVAFGECLAHLAGDEETRVILGYVEGVRDRDALIEGLRLAWERRKPVVLLKVGRSAVGAEAASSHTASLTGADVAYEALFRQYGVYRAHSIDELVDVATAACAGRFPARPEVALISISGGVGVHMADEAAAAGLSVPALPAKTQKALKALVPYAATRNPVDVTAQFLNDPGLIAKFLDLMAAGSDIGTIILFASTVGRIVHVRKRLATELPPLVEKHADRLFILSILGGEESRRSFGGKGVLIQEDPGRAVAVAAALAGFARLWARRPPRKPRLSADLPEIPHAPLNELDALALLERAGVPAVPRRLALSPGEAAEAARALGFPAAMKLVSRDIAHKSEIGGVLLDVRTARAAREGYRTLLERAGEAEPMARIDGVSVAPMVSGGVETILGARDDPSLGPVVMFGLGGVFVEVFGDVTHRLAPFDEREAMAMIAETRAAALLAGARGHPQADTPALARALARLSLFAARNAGRFESIDVNPFLVLPKGGGGLAVDALIVARRTTARTAG